MKLTNYIKQVKNSRDGKILAKNMTYLAILQLLIYLCPLITTPYLARILGVDGFGKIAFATAVMVWFQTIADWGFNYTATRDIAKHRDNSEYVSRIFSTVFWGRWILTAISFVVLIISIFTIDKFYQNATLLLFAFIMIPGHILFPDWFFQALERMEFITILNAVVRIIFMISVFFVIRQPEDYIYQPLLISVGYVICGFVATYIVLVKWKIKITSIPLKDIFLYIKNSTNIFINNLMPNLYNSFSYILLNFASTDADTGLYNAGRKFPEMANSILSVIGRAFFPYLNRDGNRHHKEYSIFSLVLAFLASVLLIVFAKPLTYLFFGNDFIDAVIVLRITSIAIFFNTINTIYGVNYLMVIGRDRLLRNLTIIASAIGFVVSFPLVYYFDYIGISISFLIANILMGIMPMIAVLLINKNK